MKKIVVVGAGQAGAACVAKLRHEGFSGAITLIGSEPVPPYQRPPLSKAYLMGDINLERLMLRPKSFYDDMRIDLILGTPVNKLDPRRQIVELDNLNIGYDALVLATGSTPRRLPASMGGNLRGVHVIRSLSDVDAMAPRMLSGHHVLIVGGGYIGLEAAAVASKLGMVVTLIEMAPRILQRVAARETSDYIRAIHTGHGVSIKESTGLERLLGSEHVSGAVLSDGTELNCDMVIVGIGVLPDTGLAENAGLLIDNGIRTDAYGRTSAQNIWAAGDCASFPFNGSQIRLESVQNAIDQAEIVAANLLGAEQPYNPDPWFWSDQYDLKLQIAGLNSGYTRVVVRTDGLTRSHWYYSNDKLLAVDAINDPRAYMIGKRMLASGLSPDPKIVRNPKHDLKSLLGM